MSRTKPAILLPFFSLATVALALGGAVLACSASGTHADAARTEDDLTAPGGPGSAGAGDAAPDPGAPPVPEACKPAEPSNVCGVSPQCGCAEGKTCDVVDASGSARCITAGDTPMGHPCGAVGECAVGMTCVFGTCHAFCSAPGEACSQPGTGACVQVVTMEGEDVPNLAVCRVACAPHDPASCGGTTAVCNIDPDGNTECQSGGSGKEGEACSPTEACGPGLGCVTSDETSTCRRWCRLGESDCGASGSCVGFAPEITVRGVPYGACS